MRSMFLSRKITRQRLAQARIARDFGKADRIREDLRDQGVFIDDSGIGPGYTTAWSAEGAGAPAEPGSLAAAGIILDPAKGRMAIQSMPMSTGAVGGQPPARRRVPKRTTSVTYLS